MKSTVSTFVALLLVACLPMYTAVKTTKEWKRRTIYQILTDRFARTDGRNENCPDFFNYCGGSWLGLTNNIDYIKNMGFTGIWTSFPVENVAKGYHGYWPRNMYNLNSRFGSEGDLSRFVQIAHDNKFYVMADIVVNHMGPYAGRDSGFDHYWPFNRREHYHSYCVVRYDSSSNEIENCRLGSETQSLPDLDTENSFVLGELKNWFVWFTNRIDWDGFRLDAVKHVRFDFWQDFLSTVQNRGIGEFFSMGEVFNGDPVVTGRYQNSMPSVLNFPLYYTIKDVFALRQSMTLLPQRIQQMRANFKDTTVLGNFVDNHDVQRFGFVNGDRSNLKNALLYILTIEGIPIVYYGTEQHYKGGNDPQNREPLWYSNYNRNADLYQFLAGTNEFRNLATDDFHENLHESVFADGELHVFKRGSTLVAVTNQGSNSNVARTFQVTMEAGTFLLNYYNPSERITFPSSSTGLINQSVTITLNGGQPKLFCSQRSCPHRFR